MGSGDTEVAKTVPLKFVDQLKSDNIVDEKESPKCENLQQDDENEKAGQNEITPQMIDDNEAKLKDRIAQCRNIIESLKIELCEEKIKLENQSKSPVAEKPVVESVESPAKCTTSHFVPVSNTFLEDVTRRSDIYSDCVENKLGCDEHLMEYEKQLQKYQNTLNMAQNEKKNAIRKQMLAKAYRLKLLEVENQCNIELLRIKQSLQCLEPLKLVASKWKTTNISYDTNNYDLIPRYPELISSNNSCDLNICRGELNSKSSDNNNYGDVSKDNSILPD